MRVRVTTLLIVMVMSGSVSSLLADETPAVRKRRIQIQEARTLIKEAWSKVKTLTANSVQSNVKDIRVAAISSTLYGTYYLSKKGGKVLVRQEVSSSSSMDFKDHDISTTQDSAGITIGDGDIQYGISTVKTGTTITKYDQSPMLSIGGLDPLQFFFERYTVNRLPDSTVDGYEVIVLEATARTKRPRRAVISINKKYGIIQKRVSYDHQGMLRSSMTYNNIKVNVEIDPKKFVFVPIQGVPIEDRTTK